MKEEKNQPVELPENAFRELGEGEEYQPVMSPSKIIRRLLYGRSRGEL